MNYFCRNLKKLLADFFGRIHGFKASHFIAHQGAFNEMKVLYAYPQHLKV